MGSHLLKEEAPVVVVDEHPGPDVEFAPLEKHRLLKVLLHHEAEAAEFRLEQALLGACSLFWGLLTICENYCRLVIV